MNGFVIKYNDIYNLLWEYKSKLENLMERIDVCQESINRFIGDSGFQGKAATAIKSYMNDVHLTMLSSFRVTIQSLLDNIVLYKAGYYGIDDSTNFVIPEETIKEFRTKLNTNYMEMQEQEDGVYRAVSGISDISSVGQPDTNQVPKIHQQLDQELLNLITDIETQESSTVTALEQSTELLITSLNNCIGKIGTNWTDINSYEGNSFYTDVDAYVLANLSQMFYQQHEANQEVYDEIWEVEQSLKDAAEERETMGIWKTIGGAALVITGVFCIAASGGAATPVVVAGWTSGGVTVAFGVCDSIEGAQDIYYGSMGDIDSTAFNCLKDVVFQGNEDAYYMVENIFACSASACIPISRASQVGQLTFRSGSVIAAKEVMSTVIGDKTSELTMDLTGNRTLSMLAGMVSSNASAHGLNGLDARFNWSGYTYQSLLGPMSPEEAKAYEHFMKNGSEAGLTEIELNALQKVDGQIALNKIDIDEWLKFKKSESGLDSGLTQSQIEDIVNTPKGSRPDPSSYLSQEYIDAHLAQFDDGVSVIQTEWAYSRYSETNGFVGVPDDNSLFVMPKNYCDDVIARANGNISIIEKELGFPEGYFSDGGGLIRIDAPNTPELNIRIPSGNETGANKLWIPGGKTSGGVPEAITNTIPLKDTTITRIDVD